MNALVVGGPGFLGLNLIETLQAEGHAVASTRRVSSNTIFVRRLKVPLLEASLEDVDSLAAAMEGRDTVFLAAGYYPRYSVRDHEGQLARAVAGIRNALEAARRAGVARVVYTGSVVTVRRRADGEPATEADGLAEAPRGSLYFAVKIAMEREVLRAVEVHGQDVVLVLPTGCLGPYDHKVGTGFFVVGMANRMLPVYLDGRINLVDVRDVARGHLLAAAKGRAGERYVLGGHDVTVEQALRLLAERLEVEMPAQKLTPELAGMIASLEEHNCAEEGCGRPLLSREIVDLIRYGQHVRHTKATRELGYTTRPLAATLAAAVDWYRRNGYIRRSSG